MSLPINGRIAIIDDQIKHAEPLMQVLSQKQMPFTYFSGDMQFLPEEGRNGNDIRLLFLDINLIDNSEHVDKMLKARLIPILRRVISEENYPYVIVYWSRHEHHKLLIENDIFENDLNSRKPIGYLSANKLDYFNLDGEASDDFDKKIEGLFESINNKIDLFPSYNYLLHWENEVHYSADYTLQEIFSSCKSSSIWLNKSNYIINKLSKAYLGNHFEEASPEDKIKGGFNSFNPVFIDTLENKLSNLKMENPIELTVDDSKVGDTKIIISILNEKLNIARKPDTTTEPGAVLSIPDKEELYKRLLDRVISFFSLKTKIALKHALDINDVKLKKMAAAEKDMIKSEIKKSWTQIAVVVTPLCDYAQKNNKIYDRVVKGVLINATFKEYIDDKSEAVFISPSFNYGGEVCFLVLDYRYFLTIDIEKTTGISAIFRVRQQLLAEMQSKLARHISRQGILFLDEGH